MLLRKRELATPQRGKTRPSANLADVMKSTSRSGPPKATQVVFFAPGTCGTAGRAVQQVGTGRRTERVNERQTDQLADWPMNLRHFGDRTKSHREIKRRPHGTTPGPANHESTTLGVPTEKTLQHSVLFQSTAVQRGQIPVAAGERNRGNMTYRRRGGSSPG